jgi:trehalose 6-phosphate phosphatase
MLYYQMTGFMQADVDGPEPDEAECGLPDLANAALFLDFDGTLVDIADTPGGVTVPSEVADLLARAYDRLDGRVAIVSGRTTEDLRRFLPGFAGPLVGAHGTEIHEDGETRRTVEVDEARVAFLQRLVRDFARLQPAFLVEDKPTGVVLHYRAAQELGALAMGFMDSVAKAAEGFKLQPALCAYEIKPEGAGKDVAIAALMARAPFEGHLPIYAGDDLTDEPALQFAMDGGGAAIKVGGCETVARHRIDTPEGLRARLGKWLA